MTRKRILLVSDNPLLFSGLGRWGREVSLRLYPDHDIAFAGWHYQGQRHDYPFHIYPLEKLSPNSFNQFAAIIEDFQPDVIMGLGDIDYFGDFVTLRERFAKSRAIEYVLYLTVDGAPLNPNWIPIAKAADKIFVCTEFAKKALEALGNGISAEVDYLGYSPDVFGVSGNREVLRNSNGFGQNKFIVMANQQNTVRHNLNALIWAFSDFVKENKEANTLLYINTDTEDNAGPNLWLEAKRAGIEDKVMFGKNHSVLNALPDNQVNGLYNISDVIVAPSCNEGFGLPVLEAMASGVVPIVTNYASLAEITGGLGILVPPGAYLTTNIGIRQAIISHTGLVKALSVAYTEFKDKRADFDKRRQLCVDFAKQYTWSRTAKKLKDYVGRHEVSPLYKEAQEAMPAVTIGIMTPWNEKCGIAEHNAKYITKLSGDPVVLACEIRSPKEESILDEAFVVRCWNRKFDDYKPLLAEIVKRKISVLHIHHEFSFFENIDSFIKFLKEIKKMGIKTMLTYHTAMNINNILLAATELVDKVSVCFNDEVDFLKDSDLEHIPNAIEWVDDMPKEEARKKLGLTSSHIIVSSGFWQEHKGYYQVIQIIPELLTAFPDLLYIIVGTHGAGHPYFERVKKLIQQLKLEDHVLIVDKYATTEELYDYLHAADVLVYNYFVNFQSASAAALTGLSAHRPIITTDSPMFSYIKNEAIKTPMGNLQRISRAIKELFEDTSYANILVGRADRLLKTLDPDKIAQKYTELYEELKPWTAVIIENPDVLIGVPTFNDYERVDVLLTSIEQNTDSGFTSIEKVVVDDGTTNKRKLAGLRRVCKKHGVTLIEHEVNKGIPSAWNTLTNFNKNSKYVVLFNDDIKVTNKDWLKTAIFALESNPTVGSIGWPLIQIDKSTGQPNAQYALPDTSVDIGVVGAAVGCCFAFKREAYNKTKGFWEDLVSFYEEIDFGFQMKVAGYESLMLPYPACEHWGSQTFSQNQVLAVRDVDESLMPKWEYINILKDYKTHLAIKIEDHLNLLAAGKAYRMDMARALFSKRWQTRDKFINPQAEVHNALFKDRKPVLMKWYGKDMQVVEKEI